MIDFLEHVRDPASELDRACGRLVATGRVVVSTPCVDSFARRALGRHWPQYRGKHLTFFSREGLRALLRRSGLEPIAEHPTRKAITPAYAYGQSRAYPIPVASTVTNVSYRALPFLRHRRSGYCSVRFTMVAMVVL